MLEVLLLSITVALVTIKTVTVSQILSTTASTVTKAIAGISMEPQVAKLTTKKLLWEV